MGVLILTVLNNGLGLLNATSTQILLVNGLLFLVVVLLDGRLGAVLASPLERLARKRRWALRSVVVPAWIGACVGRIDNIGKSNRDPKALPRLMFALPAESAASHRPRTDKARCEEFSTAPKALQQICYAA